MEPSCLQPREKQKQTGSKRVSRQWQQQQQQQQTPHQDTHTHAHTQPTIRKSTESKLDAKQPRQQQQQQQPSTALDFSADETLGVSRPLRNSSEIGREEILQPPRQRHRRVRSKTPSSLSLHHFLLLLQPWPWTTRRFRG